MNEAEIAEAFDLRQLDAGFLDDPFPTYHALRRHDPVHRMADGSYFLSRYADVLAVYRDKRMSSDKQAEFGPKFGTGGLYRHHTTSLVFNDPPLHTRVRKLIAAAFTPRALRDWEPRVTRLVDDLLDRAADRGEMDLIGDFAFALPVQVVCDMLGVPPGERAPLRDWAITILGALEPVISAAQLETGNQAVEDFCDYLRTLLAERRKHPGDDLISTLLAGSPDGETLSEEELLQNCIFLLNAGHETTANLIGNGVAALLENPDQLDLLRGRPALIETAVEEFLRFESSNQLGNRRATEATVIGGVEIPAGANIHLGIGAANRDPAEFADPDRLDISREPNRHLAFGAGAHICAGNTLARIEGRVAIAALLARCPGLRPAGLPVRGGRARFRGYRSYSVAWG